MALRDLIDSDWTTKVTTKIVLNITRGSTSLYWNDTTILTGVSGTVDLSQQSQPANGLVIYVRDPDSGLAGSRIFGAAGPLQIYGGGGSDTLIGSEGASDTLAGGGGDDLVFASMGASASADAFLSGWNAQTSDAARSAFADAIGSASSAGDRLSGGEGADTLIGAGGNDIIDGGVGNDLLFGGAGNDILRGGVGKDTIYGGIGSDLIDGGDGDDTIFDMLDTTGANDINGGAGNDTIAVTAASGLKFARGKVNGGSGDDTITASGYVTGILMGGEGHDFIDARNANAVSDGKKSLGFDIAGGTGADTIYGGAGADTADGGTGSDLVDLGEGDDAGIWNAYYDAGATDTMDGGKGFDTLKIDIGDVYDRIPDIFRVWNGKADPEGWRTIGSDLSGGGSLRFRNFERLDIFSGGTMVATSGTSGPGPLTGLKYLVPCPDDKDNEIVADRIGNRQDRACFLNLLGGNDFILLSALNSGVTLPGTVNGNGGNDTLIGGDADDALFGGADNDLLIGGDGRDTLDGGTGSDRLFGGAGDDLLTSSGAATMSGGEGNDTIVAGNAAVFITGDAGADSIVGSASTWGQVNGGEGNDTIDFSKVTLKDAARRLVIDGGTGDDLIRGGAGDDNIMGGSGADTIYGNGGADLINGGDGNDLIDGGDGNDVLIGWTGADTLQGGSGDDRFVFSSDGVWGRGATGTVPTVTFGDRNDITWGVQLPGMARSDDAFDGGSGTDSLVGTSGSDALVYRPAAANLTSIEFFDLGGGDDVLDLTGYRVNGTGSGQGVTIDGGSGNDVILGSDGDDLIFGGTSTNGAFGNDTLCGGLGDDIFVFSSTGGGNDVIVDFRGRWVSNSLVATDQDRIRITGLASSTDQEWTRYCADLITNAKLSGQYDASVVLNLGSNSTITLVGVTRTELQNMGAGIFERG